MLPVPVLLGCPTMVERMTRKKHHRKLVWDFPTRIFHWSLAVSVLVSFVSVRIDEMEVHFTSGAFILFLLSFRVMWGLWGSATARFVQFAPFPKRIRAWRAKTEIGHSPWGALSVFALLAALGMQAATGLISDDGIYLTGPLRDYVSSSTANNATKLHARISDAILALVALHLAAITFYTVVRKSGILSAFVTGYKSGAPKSIQPKPLLWIGATAFIAAAPVVWVFS